jgi:hypothetical protein
LIPIEEDQRLEDPRSSFKQYLLAGESFEEVDLARDRSPMRKVVLQPALDHPQHTRLHNQWCVAHQLLE